MSLLQRLELRFEKEDGIIGFLYEEVKDFQPSGLGYDMGTNQLNILTRSIKLLHNDTKPRHISKVGLDCYWMNYEDEWEPYFLDGKKYVRPRGGGVVAGHYPKHSRYLDKYYGSNIKDLIFALVPVDDICTPIKPSLPLDEADFYPDEEYECEYMEE